MKSRTKLFLTAFLAGVGLRLGIPGIVDIIQYAWESAVLFSKDAVPPELRGIISFIGLAIFFAGFYYNYEVFIKGAKKGKKGIVITVFGFVSGILVTSLFLGSAFY